MKDWKFLLSVFWRTILLFLLCNLAAIPVQMESLGKVSLYNRAFPGRERFPFGANPQLAYNLSLYNLDAMFASLRLAGSSKPADEFRVFVVGDSSVWGTLLTPEQTLAAQIQAVEAPNCTAKKLKVYNLGYPTLSVTKDVMILDTARVYQPDLVLWLVTLESLPINRQFDSPIVANNRELVQRLIADYRLPLNPNDARLVQPGWFERTAWGRRRELADLLRLQLYGPLWAATGIDQEYPLDFPPTEKDFKDGDLKFHNFTPPALDPADLGMEIIAGGMSAAGSVPVVLINEPIMISSGKNSQLRYNFYYPRWAYDQYRQILAAEAQARHWNYLDFWNSIPENDFTNSAIHLNPAASGMLAEAIGGAIQGYLCR